MAKFDIKSYIKNVVKSTGYIMTDVAKETNPIVTDFINTNSDTIKDMYSFVKDFKRNVGQKKEALADNEYAQLAKDTVHNFFDDIKTGKFYNVERSKGAEDELMRSMMGDDFNMDFDTDDWDFEDDSSGFGNLDEEKSDSLTSSDMDVIGGKITDGISKSNILSADYIVKSSRANTKKVIANNEVLFGRVNTSISAVNASIASLGKAIIPALSTHVDNSSKFYAKTTEQLTEMNAYIKKIYEILDKNIDIKEKEKKARKSSTFADSVNYNGVINLSGWGKSIKKNIESQLGMVTMLTSMIQSFGGTAAIKSLLSSPVAMIASMALSGMINRRYGENLKNINSLVGGLFGHVQTSMMKSKNPIVTAIRDILGVAPNNKHSIDTSKYNKGPKQWDGKDSKALTEVIPRLLGEILSALTGNETQIYDYERGRFTTVRKMRDSHVKNINKIAYNSQEKFNERAEDAFFADQENKNLNRQSKRYINFKQESANYHRYVLFHLKHEPRSPKEWTDLQQMLTKAGILVSNPTLPSQISTKTFNILKNTYNRYMRDGERLDMETNYLRGRDELGNYFQDAEEKGTYNAMLESAFGNSKKPSKINVLTNAIDDKGHNIFFYLQNFYNQFANIVSSLSFISNKPTAGFGGKRSKRGRQPQTSTWSPNANSVIPINTESLILAGDEDLVRQKNLELQAAKAEKIRKKKLEELKQEWNNYKKDYIKRRNRISIELGKQTNLVAIDRLQSQLNQLEIEYGIRKNRHTEAINSIGGEITTADIEDPKLNTLGGRIQHFAEENFKDTFGPGKAEGLINSILDKGLNKIYTFLYGERGDNGERQGGEEYRKGLINIIKKKTDVFFKDIKTKFKAVTDVIKEKFIEIRDRFLESDFVEGFKSFGSSIKNYFLGSAATGKTIKKDGLIAVSKGEIVVPSEYNRNYHGPTNKYAQISREASLVNRWKSGKSVPFLGSYAEGGSVGESERVATYKRKTEEARNKGLSEKIKKGLIRSEMNNSEAANEFRSKMAGARDKIKQTRIYKETTDRTNEFISKVADALRGEYDELQKNLLGDDYKSRNKKLFDLEKYGVTQKGLGRAAGGASVGLLVGGLVGMPLIGAAVGGAATLVAGSEKLQDKLFGERDAKGEYSGGFFGPGLSKLLKDTIPSYSKFLLGGGLAGALNLLPGGVVGGLVIGSAIKYASDNEKFHDYLFGDSGILGKDTDQKLKKLAPKMGIGAGIMALATPFGLGLVPSLMLGAGLGFVSDTERFKNEIFGFKDSNGERQGGLVGIFKDNIISPLTNGVKNILHKGEKYVIDNFLSPLKRLVGNIGDTIGGMLTSVRDWFTQMMKDKVFGYISDKLKRIFDTFGNTLIGKVTKTIVKAPINLLKGIGTLPGRAMNAASRGLERFNVAHGWSSKSIAERDKMWNEDNKLKNRYIHDKTGVGALFGFGKKAAKNRAYDTGLAKMNQDEWRQTIDALKMYDIEIGSRKENLAKSKKKLFTQFIGDVTGTGINTKEFQSLINNNDFVGAKKYIETLAENGAINGTKRDSLLNELSIAEGHSSSLNDPKLAKIKETAISSGSKIGMESGDFGNVKKWISKMTKDYKQSFGDAEGGDGTAKPETEATGKENNTILDIIDPVNDIRTILNKILDAINGNNEKSDEEKNAEHAAENAKNTNEKNAEHARNATYNNKEDKEQQEEEVNRAVEQAALISQILNSNPRNYLLNIKNGLLSAKNSLFSAAKKAKFGITSKIGQFVGNLKDLSIESDVIDRYGMGSGLYRFYGGDSQLDENGNPKTKIVTDDDGNVLEYERNSRGGYELSKNPMNTIVMRAKKRASDIKEKAYKSLGSMGGFFSKFFGKKEEKKKGILETLLGVGGGVLGGIGGLLGGIGVGGILKIGGALVGASFLANFLQKHPEIGDKLKAIFIGTDEKPGLLIHAKNLIVDKVIPMVGGWWEKHGESIIEGLTNGLGVIAGSILKSIPTTFEGIIELAKKLVFGPQESETPTTTIDENGNTVTTSYDKNHRKTTVVTDPSGKVISNTVEDTNKTLGAVVKDKSGNPIITGNGAVVNRYNGENWGAKPGQAFLKNGILKGQLGALPLIKNIPGAKQLGEAIGKKLNDIVIHVFRALKTIFKKEAGQEIAEEAIQQAAGEVTEQIAKQGGKEVGEKVAKALPVISLGFIAYALFDGWQDAESILGIIRPATFGEKAIAAVINGLNEAIPGIGGIIPSELFVNIILAALSTAGIISKDNKLLRDREEAKRELEKFNQENGLSYSVREYNKNVLGRTTLGEKVVNGAKSLFSGPKSQPIVYGNTQTTYNGEYGTYGGKTGAQFGTGSGLYNYYGGASNQNVPIDPTQAAVNAAISRYVGNSKIVDPIIDITNMLDYMDVSKHPKTDGFRKIPDKYKNTSVYVPMKLANYFIGNALPFARIINFVYSKLDKVIDTAQSSSSNVSSFLSNISSGLFGNISSGLSSAGGKIASWAGGIFNKITGNTSNTSDSSTSDTTTDATASGSHVSQKGIFRRFGHSTVDENGCGPAVAATVLREYGRNATLDGAVDFANAGGYVAGASNVGTRSSYFGDIFARNGISSSYTNRKSDIRRAVNSGRPTVLLGQDASNRSKFNSPFGPNPHYVVASGTTRNGGVIINDPELDRPAIYSKNILNKSKLGIMTGGKSDVGTSSGTTNTSSTSGTVDEDGATWNYLKSAGLTDAGTAGLMGNLYAESGIKSNKVETASLRTDYQKNTYLKNYGITYDNDTYTAAVDAGIKQGAKGGPDNNLNPKFGIIPEYEFTHMPWKTDRKKSDGTYFGQNGYGIVQWTTAARKQGLYDLVKANNVSISDKKTQLQYLLHELKNSYKGVYQTLTTSNNLQQASDKVLYDFESPSKASEKSKERLEFSQKYYNKYSNNPPTDASFGDGSSTSSGGANISFPVYNLDEAQLKGVANILQNEQSGIKGRYAEASLMANLLDAKDESRATASALEEYLTKPPGKNWFAHGRKRYNEGKAGEANIEDTALKAAIDIFNNGKRTMPRYINEHDCFSDISSTNPEIDKKNKSAYVPNVTKVKNKYGSTWTFYSFPDNKADPFGYTSEELRSKWGEGHYNIDDQGNLTVPEGFSEGSGSSGTPFANQDSSSNGTDFWGTISNIFGTVLKGAFGKMGKVGEALSSLFGFNTSSSSGALSDSSGSTGSSSSSGVSISPGNLAPYNGEIYDGNDAGKVRPLVGVSAENHPALNVINAARSQLGVKERGSNGQDFGALTGNTHDKWCASFVSWAFRNGLGSDDAGKKALYGPYSASVQGLLDNFKAHNALVQDPQPGDVILWKSGRSHTGIVQSVNSNGTITTVEGNSGDMVKSNNPAIKSNGLTGYGRPNWDAVDTRANKTGFTTSSGTGDAPAMTESTDDTYSGGRSGLSLYRYIGGKAAIGTSSEYDYNDRDDGHAKPYPTGYGTPRSMIEIARSQLGVLEGGVGEKDENGKWIPHSGNITDYGKFMGMDRQPWCASFVSWVMDKTFNGAKNKRNHALRGNPSAAVDGLWSNFKAAGEMHDTPEPGDIVIYKNDTSHTGIVETVNGNHITTIEGNTSSGNTFERNGGIVFRKEFTLGDGSSMANKLTGFGRPNWNAEKEFGTGSGLYRLYGGASGSIPSLDRYLDKKSSNRRNTLNKPFNNFNTTSKKIEEEKKKKQAIDIANRAKASMSWEADNEAIRKQQNANYNTARAAASWEADNEAIRKQQNANYYLAAWDKEQKDIADFERAQRELKAWDEEQKAINQDIATKKAASSWEADNEAIRKMMNANYAKEHGTSSSSSNGSSYSGSSGSYSSGSSSYSSGAMSTENLASMLEYLKIIAENTTNNTSIKTIVEILTSLTKIVGATNQASVQEQSNVTKSNVEDDARREKIQSELNTVMAQLRQIAQSA